MKEKTEKYTERLVKCHQELVKMFPSIPFSVTGECILDKVIRETVSRPVLPSLRASMNHRTLWKDTVKSIGNNVDFPVEFFKYRYKD